MSIKVLLADDQQLMRDGIKLLLELETDIELISEASDGREAVAQYKLYKPDVVLMDIEMPELNGIDASLQIKAFNKNAKILVLTTFGQENYLRRSLLAGAQGFLLKAVSGSELADSIRRAHRGESVLDGHSTDLLLQSYRALSKEHQASEDVLLNKKELQIISLIDKQFSNRDIARKLNLAEGTIKNYISQILDKLQVRDRKQAVSEAKSRRLLD